jgi:hypothetical protein
VMYTLHVLVTTERVIVRLIIHLYSTVLSMFALCCLILV